MRRWRASARCVRTASGADEPCSDSRFARSWKLFFTRWSSSRRSVVCWSSSRSRSASASASSTSSRFSIGHVAPDRDEAVAQLRGADVEGADQLPAGIFVGIEERFPAQRRAGLDEGHVVVEQAGRAVPRQDLAQGRARSAPRASCRWRRRRRRSRSRSGSRGRGRSRPARPCRRPGNRAGSRRRCGTAPSRWRAPPRDGRRR